HPRSNGAVACSGAPPNPHSPPGGPLPARRVTAPCARGASPFGARPGLAARGSHAPELIARAASPAFGHFGGGRAPLPDFREPLRAVLRPSAPRPRPSRIHRSIQGVSFP